MIDIFSEAIKQGLQREDKVRDHFYITDIAKAADGCLRQLWLDFQHAPKAELGPGKMLMFENGNRLHEMINDYLLQSGLFTSIVSEERCELIIADERFSGRYDCLAENNGVRAIFDYKTVRGAAFQHLDEPKDKDVVQVQAYLMSLDLRTGYVIYIDREGQNGWRGFEVGRDDDTVKTLALECIKARNVEPPILEPIYKKDELKTKTNYYVTCPWQCQYCDYYEVSCKGAMPKDLDIGTKFAAEHTKDGLSIKDGFEQYFKDMRKFDV